MKQIKIKTESLPFRCEICHLSDLFDPATNQCQRCDIDKLLNTKTSVEKLLRPPEVMIEQNDPEKLVLCMRWVSPVVTFIVTVVFTILGLVLTLLVLSILFGSNMTFDITSILTTFAVALIPFFMFYTVVAALINKTKVIVDKELITVKPHPIPFSLLDGGKVPIRDLKKIVVLTNEEIKGELAINGVMTSYNLIAKTLLGSYLLKGNIGNQEVALYLKQMLEERLTKYHYKTFS